MRILGLCFSNMYGSKSVPFFFYKTFFLFFLMNWLQNRQKCLNLDTETEVETKRNAKLVQ